MAEAAPSELVARAQRGNSDAFGDLYLRYYQSIYRYLYYRTTDQQTAEDLTAEVFLKMVQALPRYQPQAAPFQAWLFQIARNLAIDHHRRNQSHPIVILDEALPGHEPEIHSSVESRLTQASLKSCLGQIEESQREVILLRFIEELSITDTASILHKSEDAIKGLQRRALLALRELLGDHHVR